MRKILNYLVVAIKGACMGAADVVPGVSGGTIAFMTGIYGTLVESISSVNMTAMKLLFKGRLREFWKHINGNFLVALFGGVILSVLSLAKLMTYLLAHQPIQTWAFFFGLIVASSVFIIKGIDNKRLSDLVPLLSGICLGVVVCSITPTNTPEGLWFILISGAIAICAMILPGVSGSFILLILGKYEFVLGTVAKIVSGKGQTMDFLVLLTFLAGAVCGILAFSKLLNYLLKRHYKSTLLVMAGFIIGSLVRVWPWSNMETVISAQFPEAQAMLEAGIPAQQVIGIFKPQVNMHIGSAIVFALIGLCVVTGLELASASARKRSTAQTASGNAEIPPAGGQR